MMPVSRSCPRYRHTCGADWESPADVKRDFGAASILKDGRVVFNIAGNKYRLVVWINYPYRVVYVRFLGTHAQYDEIDAQAIQEFTHGNQADSYQGRSSRRSEGN